MHLYPLPSEEGRTTILPDGGQAAVTDCFLAGSRRVSARLTERRKAR